MAYSRPRRVHRIRLAHPLIARLGPISVVLVDISLDGAKIEHREPIKIGAEMKLSFDWDDYSIEVRSRVTRCKLERFSGGSDGLTVFHSGLQFLAHGGSIQVLRKMVSFHISRALEEQRLNASGALPPSVENMPIFRGHTLTANRGDADSIHLHEALPTTRIARQVGYICYRLIKNSWKRTRTEDPEQPEEGFTVSAAEDLAQIEGLCETYRKSDQEGRELIRLLARLSITEGEGIEPGRFEP
ncbi:MAG TPA: PilZ domain-containing protein [Thermoanaerobaculia bacterium]|nr:PilZ domain-containing protein [Thermoanaerobaculia bacterium]